METTGFRHDCRSQANAALHFLGAWFGRYAPNGNGRVGVRLGCLLFAPFITLTVWLLQALVWIIVAIPILIYALVMAAIGGGFRTQL